MRASIYSAENTAVNQIEFIIDEDFSQYLILNTSFNKIYDIKIHPKLKPSLDQQFEDDKKFTFQLYNQIIPNELILEIIHRTFFSIRCSTDI